MVHSNLSLDICLMANNGIEGGEGRLSYCSMGCWKRTVLSVCTQKGPCLRSAAERKCFKIAHGCCCLSLGLSGEMVHRSRLWAGETGLLG